MKFLFYLLIFLIAPYALSQNKFKLKPERNNYECALKKEKKIDRKLGKKGYYGKIFQIDNNVTLTKSYSIDVDSDDNILIEITKALKTSNPTQKEISSLNSKSKHDVFILLKDLKKVFQEKHNICNLKEYYIRIDYEDVTNYKLHRFEYRFEYKLLMKLLKNINIKKSRQEILEMISNCTVDF